MEPASNITIATATSSPILVPAFGIDLFSVLGGVGVSGGVIGFFVSLWTGFAVLAYVVSIILLVFYVFAAIRRNLYSGLMTQELRDAEKLFDEQFRGINGNSRLNDVLAHSSSTNPNDWKLAIIEADIILDDILKKRGYTGNSLGDRLKNISGGQLDTLDDAWEAHKIRNRIAHDGADFILTKRIAEETISRYQRVFKEFGVA